MRSTLGPGKATRPLKPDVLALMESKGMRKDDPILVRAFKQEKTLEVWKRDKTGRFALLKTYPLCTTGGGPGPKIKEGDKQSPEGFYTVTPWRMNPNSQYHLSYDVGYPNAFDRAWGRTGAAIMVHGGCTPSAGCFIGTDEQIEEIYGLAREAFSGGQKSFQVQAYQFRMTAENMAKHRKNPNMAFWKNIKQGHDHFEVTRLEPKVDVCEKRYVFDAQPKDPASATFNATGACPTFEVPAEVTTKVAAKQTEDDKAFKVAAAELDDADRKETERLVAEKLEKSKPQKPEIGRAHV
jgi:murein L,D-transpeptidase YafK